MTIPNRTVTITGVFASSASTTIPSSPVAGSSYRNTALTSTIISNGWAFKTIVDSSDFNQALYEYSYITKQIETYGFLPWSSLTDYAKGAICFGSNEKTYQAVQATGPSTTARDPVNDTSHTYWKEFLGQFVTVDTTQTISGNKTFSGTNTFSNTITGSITGNAGTVTNGVYTTGNQTIGGTKTFSSTISGSINGNAGSATKLQTSRNINGTAFNGTGNITTANWGTARNITISDSDGTNTGSAVSVNGSAAVTLKLPATIKASLSGNASTVTNGVYTNTAQTISGNKTFTGTVTLNGTVNAAATTKSDIVKWMMPNYSTSVNLVNGTAGNGTYTPTKNGYIHVRAIRNERQASVAVNNVMVFDSDYSASYANPDNSMIPVAKGDVITWYASRSESLYINFFECYGG